jgi:hypothetical protein
MALYSADVLRAGPIEDGAIMIHLRVKPDGGAEQVLWVRAHEPVRKEMLATALSAITSSLMVEAAIEDPLVENATLHRLYLRA